ncbi:MAG TPA: hypothetical protein VGD91_02115, partial [Trebonia sp.]
WAEADADRIATAPRWLQVAAHEDASRLDVFGGTGSGRQNMVTGVGWELLESRAVIVLDLSQDRVAEGLLAAAARAGLSHQDYRLPGDLGETPLLAGLSGEQIASLIVEVVHADDASATAAGRATDLMILRKITGVLGADVSMGRLHAALTTLLGAGPETEGPQSGHLLTDAERDRLAALFGDGFRHQVAGNLVRLAAVVEPLTALGTGAGPRPPARLTCLSLADGPRDVAADLTAALVVQWITRAVSADAGGPAEDGGEDAFRPAVILAGADEQSTRHLARLTAVCERYDIPLVRAFSRLTEESARHLDTRHTAFMRLATRPEALRAAEHIGLERRFVAGRFAHSRSVSRLRTRTTSDSVTHTAGRTEGESATHTTGTTKGQSYSETEIPRHEQQPMNIRVDTQHPQGSRDSGRDTGNRDSGRDNGNRDSGGRDSGGRGERPGRDEPAGGKGANPRGGEPRPGNRGGSGGGWGGSGGGSRGGGGGGVTGGGGTRVTVQGGGTKPGRPKMDIARSRTRFTAQHESDATTKSSSATEETSHTSSTSNSRTDGVSVGDEIGYELVYDHKVQPETLMALPEDQMLAPHVVEAAAPTAPAVAAGSAAPGSVLAAGNRAGAASKMVALVIDPSVVGSEAVAAVRPGEIPAFEPPAPPVSAQVPDYERVRPQLPSSEGSR